MLTKRVLDLRIDGILGWRQEPGGHNGRTQYTMISTTGSCFAAGEVFGHTTQDGLAILKAATPAQSSVRQMIGGVKAR